MATNKAKRSIHLTQPNNPPTELMPVRAHVYRTIAEVNDGFEHAMEGLQTLLKIKYLSSGGLDQMLNMVCRIRAHANRELIAVIDERETTNANLFQQHCLKPEKAVNH